MDGILIYALGDSITYGFPYGPNHSWVKMVSARLKLRIINGGINGDTVSNMLQRLPRALAAGPSHLILLGGANDAYWGRQAASIGREAEEICRRVQEAGVVPILGLPTPVDEPAVEGVLAGYRAQYLDLAARYGLDVIPFNQAFIATTGRFRVELTTDGCHPTIDGYEEMAEVAEKSLKKILKI